MKHFYIDEGGMFGKCRWFTTPIKLRRPPEKYTHMGKFTELARRVWLERLKELYPKCEQIRCYYLLNVDGMSTTNLKRHK